MTDTGEALVYRAAARSHQGCVRRQNEDSHACLPQYGLWVVADGMGGYAAGDVASEIVTSEMTALGMPVSASDQRRRVSEGLHRAHLRIRSHIAEHDLDMAGSTIAALMVFGTELTCAWVGDSRIYRLRAGQMRRMTRDHSEVAAMVERGDLTPAQAREFPRRHVLTRAVGIGPNLAPEFSGSTVQAGDRFLICSDGLTEQLADDEIAEVLDSGRDPGGSVDRLVALTLLRGAVDNVTVLVLDCAQGAPEGSDHG